MTMHRSPLRRGLRPVQRRLRAAIVGLGCDGPDGSPQRILTGEQCLIVGGSSRTHAAMLETVLRLEVELERLGQHLGELTPTELAELAWRIDSPELHRVALRLKSGLERLGWAFHETSPEDLTALAVGGDP